MNARCLLLLSLTLPLGLAVAQPPAKDPRVEKIIRRISPERLRESVESLVRFGTRHTLSDTSSPTRGIGAARRWIKSRLDGYARSSNGRMTVAYEQILAPPGPRIPGPATVVNVVATLRPADPANPSARRMIIVGAHYDSRAADVMDTNSDAPGADDDGSGTALVLELARVLSGENFNTTVLFVLFAGEEQGLVGSAAMAQRAVSEGWDVEAVLNNDLVGASRGGDGVTDSTDVRVFSEAYTPQDTGREFLRSNTLGLENDGASRSLARYVQQACEKYVKGFHVNMVYRLDRFLRGGDHAPFHRAGFAAVRCTEAKEDFDRQHQTVRREMGLGDLPEQMDFSYLARVARLNAATVASLAFAPAPVPGAGIVTSQPGYDTQLRWRPSPGPGVAGYLIRWRATHSPFWEHARFTKDTTVTLPVSKDDYLFGVSAVNPQGNASPVVLPLPVR